MFLEKKKIRLAVLRSGALLPAFIILSMIGGGTPAGATVTSGGQTLAKERLLLCQQALQDKTTSVSELKGEGPKSENIFLKDQPSNLTLNAIEYNKIASEHFMPAFARGIREVRKRIQAIRHDQRAPDFENTILALEKMDEPLDFVSTIFGNFMGFQSNEKLQQLAQRVQPVLLKLSNTLYYDQAFFKRVQKVYEQRETLALTTAERTLLEGTYSAFLRNGVNLPEAEKSRLKAIKAQLAKLSLSYTEHLREYTKTYEYVVTDKTVLAGLPAFTVAAAAERAENAGHKGAWVFGLDQASYGDVLTFAENRNLRETIWRAFNTRASVAPFDNRPVLFEIAKLREEQAHLLGFKTYADYTVAERMAKNVETINKFLDRLTATYKLHAQNDLKELESFANLELRPWDLGFYSEKLKQERYSVSDEELRPYLSLDKVIGGALKVAEQLYGISFVARPDLPVWDPTVRAFEVRDENNKELALFYIDPFYRKSKRAGAWMTNLRSAGVFNGQMRRPHVINVYNLAPPTNGGPSLISLDDVRTVFHELGHGLHGMLTRVESPSLAGTSVAWDAVELPSQIFENWAMEPEVLSQYAVHYQTGKPLPAELIERVQKAKNFQAGLQGLRQILLAKLDLAYHGQDLHGLESAADVERWEAQAKAPYLLIAVPGQLTSTSFSHIFSGGYAGGYYSYKWAEVLAADAFSVFQKNGVFDPETARKFRQEILEKGGIEMPDVLYKRFRGQDPDPDALLRSEGLIP